MSKENAKLFIEKIENDNELQKKLKQLEQNDSKQLRTKMVEMGAEAGITFNESELEEMLKEIAMEQTHELDETELESAVGGRSYKKLDPVTRFIKIRPVIHCVDKDDLKYEE